MDDDAFVTCPSHGEPMFIKVRAPTPSRMCPQCVIGLQLKSKLTMKLRQHWFRHKLAVQNKGEVS